MLVDPFPAFVKELHLQRSTEKTKCANLFLNLDAVLMNKAKDSDCLSAYGLTFQLCRGSEKQTQAAKNLTHFFTLIHTKPVPRKGSRTLNKNLCYYVNLMARPN